MEKEYIVHDYEEGGERENGEQSPRDDLNNDREFTCYILTAANANELCSL
jgi:hypothetical protein